jgi:hypothetical protein
MCREQSRSPTLFRSQEQHGNGCLFEVPYPVKWLTALSGRAGNQRVTMSSGYRTNAPQQQSFRFKAYGAPEGMAFARSIYVSDVIRLAVQKEGDWQFYQSPFS